MKDAIHILVTTNKPFLPGAFVTLGSLLDANGGKDDFLLHIIDTGIGEEGRASLTRFLGRYPNADVKFHTIDESRFAECSKDYGGGVSTYARLFMGSLIDAPRCIYIDADMLVLKDVAELWRRDMNGKIMLALHEYELDGTPLYLDRGCPFAPPEQVRHYPYYCMGSFLCDLNAWRAFDAEKKAFELIRQVSGKLPAWDQTVLDYLLRDHLGAFDRSWDIFARSEPFRDDVIYHFGTKQKPWGRTNLRLEDVLWHTYYRIRVRPFWRFKTPLKIQAQNALWSIAYFFLSFFFQKQYLAYKQRVGCPPNEIWATQHKLTIYRQYVLHGLDAQSRVVLKKLEHHWKELAQKPSGE